MRSLLLLVVLMLLLSCALYLFIISIGGLPHDTPPGAFTVAVAHAAPAPLVVDALSVPDGVLVSWSSPQPRAIVFRRRQGDSDLFLGQYSGLALTDCGGRSGDSYIVQAWDADGTSLIAQGQSGEAMWRMWLVEVGR
jgi:hypothetical protein